MGLRVASDRTSVRQQNPRRRGDGADSVWRGRRAGLFSSLRLALLRLARGWRLLIGVALGMVVAVVLVCTVPLYDALVVDLQLQRTLSAQAPSAANVQAQVQNSQVSAAQRATASRIVDTLAHQYLGGFTAASASYYTVSDSLLLLKVGGQTFDPASSTAPQVQFRAYDYGATAPHMRVIAGQAPEAAGTLPDALITQDMADAQRVRVGDVLTYTQFGNHSLQLSVRVSGIWEPTSADDPYWNGQTFSPGSDSPIIYPVLLTYDAFFGQLATLQGVGMQQNWIFHTQPDRLTASNIAATSDSLGRFRTGLNGDLVGQEGVGTITTLTSLDQLIGTVQRQQDLLALPLYVVVALILSLTLLFIAAVASMLIEGQSQEIATLKSRGASGTQMLGVFTTQGVIVALLALLAGPFLAALLALGLVRWFVPTSAAGVDAQYLARVASPGAVILPALLGTLLGILAVAFSAWQSARRDVLAFRREQGRVIRPPLWRRYYLDVALAVLCFAGYLELGQFGGISTREQLSGGGASPLLLVTPALLLLAGALLVLRIFPYGAGLAARLSARGRGAVPLLATAQVERNPARYNRMTLLLVLAVGLGLFALAFDASLTTNAGDRANYTAGADVRVKESTSLKGSEVNNAIARLSAMPGVMSISPVYRTRAQTSWSQGGDQVDVLAIDPATFGQIAGPTSWRADYADQSLEALLGGLQTHVRGTGAGTAGAPLWAIVSTDFAALHHLHMGDQFSLQPDESIFSPSVFVVGAEVRLFPTMYPAGAPGAFIVTDAADYYAAVAAGQTTGGSTPVAGPNEFWLRTSSDPAQQQALRKALDAAGAQLQIAGVVALADVRATIQANPIAAGIRGLLLVGAVTAALLAVLGSIMQALVAARQRATQFAVLRTVGLSARQLAGLLLGEQTVVYLFGLAGGTALGLLLVTVTLPFLEFSDTALDPSTIGVPSYLVAFNPVTLAVFYGALVVAFVVALLVAARYAARIGIGNALRIGED